jgi:transmembrane 9 superfamily protein 2/4
VPFGVIWIELYYVLSTIWLHVYNYTTWLYLFFCAILLVLACFEVAIVLVYFQLCGEDYHWWWRSFLYVGSSALYFYLYTIFLYSMAWANFGFASAMVYFTYNLFFAFVLFLLTGAAGFLGCFYFVRHIYSSHIS